MGRRAVETSCGPSACGACRSCLRRIESLCQARDRVEAHARRLGADHETSQDIAARAIEVAWRRWSDVPQPLDEAVRWLCAVAGWELRNLWRSTTRRCRLLERLAGTTTVHTAAIDEGRLAAYEAATALSPAEREVLWLSVFHLDGLQELAGVLDCSPKAASMRLSRARQNLRRSWGEN